MPYDPAQVRLFQMIAHGKAAPHKGLSKGKAAKLLAEAGQSHDSGHKHKSASHALTGKK